MSQDESAADRLTALLIASGAESVPGQATMYELNDVPSAETHAALLSLIRGFEGTCFLLPSDDPVHEAPEFTWEHADAGTWVLPDNAPSEALLGGVFLPGAWRIYVSDKPAPAEDAPDLFRGPSIAALDFLERYGVSVVLDAWHDNAQWRVAFLP